MAERSLGLEIAGDGYDVACEDASTSDFVEWWSRPLRGAAASRTRLVLRAAGESAPALEIEGGFVRRCDRAEDLVPVLEGFLWERLARPSRGLAVLHAAALARRDEAAIFVGDSGAGKSVLSLTLARRGWRYLSDELVPVDEGGRVLAVPRPVTFDASEIDLALWEQISAGCLTRARTVRVSDGSCRTLLHAVPEKRAVSGEAFGVCAIYRLEARRGAAPRLHRVPGPEARAWLFGLARGAAEAAAAP